MGNPWVVHWCLPVKPLRYGMASLYALSCWTRVFFFASWSHLSLRFCGDYFSILFLFISWLFYFQWGHAAVVFWNACPGNCTIIPTACQWWQSRSCNQDHHFCLSLDRLPGQYFISAGDPCAKDEGKHSWRWNGENWAIQISYLFAESWQRLQNGPTGLSHPHAHLLFALDVFSSCVFFFVLSCFQVSSRQVCKHLIRERYYWNCLRNCKGIFNWRASFLEIENSWHFMTRCNSLWFASLPKVHAGSHFLVP